MVLKLLIILTNFKKALLFFIRSGFPLSLAEVTIPPISNERTRHPTLSWSDASDERDADGAAMAAEEEPGALWARGLLRNRRNQTPAFRSIASVRNSARSLAIVLKEHPQGFDASQRQPKQRQNHRKPYRSIAMVE